MIMTVDFLIEIGTYFNLINFWYPRDVENYTFYLNIQTSPNYRVTQNVLHPLPPPVSCSPPLIITAPNGRETYSVPVDQLALLGLFSRGELLSISFLNSEFNSQTITRVGYFTMNIRVKKIKIKIGTSPLLLWTSANLKQIR